MCGEVVIYKTGLLLRSCFGTGSIKNSIVSRIITRNGIYYILKVLDNMRLALFIHLSTSIVAEVKVGVIIDSKVLVIHEIVDNRKDLF